MTSAPAAWELVYRARDTKLDREVAIKVLPEAFTSDPERLARFEREAKVLASLNHPNIAAIHGLEDADGVQALVLELVEGPTLAERIAEGQIPLDAAQQRTFLPAADSRRPRTAALPCPEPTIPIARIAIETMAIQQGSVPGWPDRRPGRCPGDERGVPPS